MSTDVAVSLDDVDATAAAIAHIRALEAAESFDPSTEEPPGPMPQEDEPLLPPMLARPQREYVAPALPQRAYSKPVAAAPVATAPTGPAPMPLPKDIRNIEDIYAVYPSVGDGETHLRIERTQPKSHRGVSVAGFIADVYERLSMDEFVDRFGGNAYEIHVIGPAPGRYPNGQRPIRTLTTVDLKVPGPPVMDGGYAYAEDTMNPVRAGGPVRAGYPFAPGQVVPEAVQLRQIDADERARERIEEERRQWAEQSRPPREVLEAASRSARDAIDIARTSADEKVQILREQNQGLLGTLMRRDEELRELRDRITQAERSASDARQFTETEQIKRLTEQHVTTTSKLQDDHAREMNRVLQDSRDKLADESRRHVEERAKFESDSMRERQRLQEEADRRERAMKEQYDLVRQQSKEQYDARIADLERRTVEQIASVRETRDRELESIRTTERASATVTKETSSFRVDHLQARVAEVTGEADRLRRENEDLRRKGQKDPVQYLQEAETVARTLLGMVKPEEIEREETSSKGDDGSWKAMVGPALKGLMDGLPKVVEQVSAVRAANQQQAARQQQAAQQQAAQQAQRRSPLGLPMAPQRNLLAPPPPWASSVPPAPGQAAGMPRPFVGPVHGAPVGPVGRPRAVVSGMPIAANSIPVTGQMVFTGGSPLQPEQPLTVPTAAADPQPAQEAESPPQQVTQEQIDQFVSALNEHIGEGTPVEMFAMGLVDQIGKPTASDLITKIGAQDLLASVAKAGGEGSYILTAKGREYVAQLWVEVGKIVAS